MTKVVRIMIKKFLIFFLAAFISLSIIGVGFSSWYFGHEDLTTSINNISVYTTSSIEKGTLSCLTYPNKIVFSQGKLEVNDLTDGIDFYTLKTDNTYENNDLITIKYSLVDSNDLISASKFRMYVTLSGQTFSQFVKVSDKYIDSTTTSGYDFSSEISVVTDTSESDPYGYFLYNIHLKDLICFKSSDSKPLTKDKYKSLYESLSDASIQINFEAI